MVHFDCPLCASTISAPDSLIGKQMRCPGCGKLANVPAAGGMTHDLTLPSHMSREPQNLPTVLPEQGQVEASAAQGSGDTIPLTSFLAPSQAPDELGRLGNYRILKILGHGGMGIVFQAEDIRLKRKVAIKAMLPHFIGGASTGKRFLREAQAMAAVEHPHVARIYQVDEDRGIAYLAMEYLKGESLGDRLTRESALPLAEVVRIGRQVAEGLAAAHETGLIHRDIKPANIWLEGTKSHVKILDFGLAHVQNSSEQLTHSGMIVGTPAYMAPEQARGEKVDARTDLFSLGVVLYRLSTGRMPFHGSDAVSTLVSVSTHQPPTPQQVNPDIPARLSALIEQLMDKDPARRPASAQVIAEELQALEPQVAAAAPVAPQAPPPSPSKLEQPTEELPVAPPTSGRRRHLLLALLLLALLVPIALHFTGLLFPSANADCELLIDTDDAELQITVRNEERVLHDRVKSRRFELNPGAYEVEFRKPGANGAPLTSSRVVLEQGKQEVVSYRPSAKKDDPIKNPVLANAERRAAEWVIAQGGFVRFSDDKGERYARGLNDLPAAAWSLKWVLMGNNKDVGDRGLENLEGLGNLRVLDLGNTQVSDLGLKHIEGLFALEVLHLRNTKVSDAGLKHLKALTNLTTLTLEGTQVNGSGLEQLKAIVNLKDLDLRATPLNNAGLKYIREIGNLESLTLDETRVTDAGLEQLKALGKLRQIKLVNTAVGDSGLEHLRELANLESLHLTGSKVSEAGVKKLSEALPDCKITWDNRLFWKKAQPASQRAAALWVLSLGGTIIVRDGKGQREIGPAGVPPEANAIVERVDLGNRTKVADEGLARLRGLVSLTDLRLDNTRISDADLEHLTGLTNLKTLHLSGTRVSDEGLKKLSGLKKVESLHLSSTRVSDAGMEHLKGIDALKDLHVASTTVGDEGLRRLKPHINLRSLGLDNTPVTDAGLEHLKELGKLTTLVLHNTQITNEGLKHLKGLQNLTHLALSSTKLSDEGLEHLKGHVSLRSLDLFGSKVSEAGIKKLREVLLNCKIN